MAGIGGLDSMPDRIEPWVSVEGKPAKAFMSATPGMPGLPIPPKPGMPTMVPLERAVVAKVGKAKQPPYPPARLIGPKPPCGPPAPKARPEGVPEPAVPPKAEPAVERPQLPLVPKAKGTFECDGCRTLRAKMSELRDEVRAEVMVEAEKG